VATRATDFSAFHRPIGRLDGIPVLHLSRKPAPHRPMLIHIRRAVHEDHAGIHCYPPLSQCPLRRTGRHLAAGTPRSWPGTWRPISPGPQQVLYRERALTGTSDTPALHTPPGWQERRPSPGGGVPRGPCGCVERPDRIPHCPSSQVSAALPAQDSSAACDSRRARSAGALIMGQCPESMSRNERCLLFASSGTSPWSIHSLAWAGVNSGQMSTTGTS
jgi:hypothetical protein